MTLLRSELTKLLFQKRTYVGWIGLLIIPIVIVVALRLRSPSSQGDAGPGGFFILAAHNGLLVPLAAIGLLTAFLLPLLAAMAGSYQLAGEAESGTIKTWLVHPVSRGGVLVSKWAVAALYLLAGLALVAAGAYVVGVAVFGAHAPALLSGGTVSIAHGLWLTLLTYLFVAAGMVCVISLAMLLSTLTDSSLTAAIGTLVILIVMQVLGAFSYFDFLKPYLFTSHLDAWQGFFQRTIDWAPVEKGLLAFGVYIVASTAAAWYLFRRKDVLV
jgi:ABC-2 type transport system permease protein